jgi:hypothetical protein
MQSIISRTLILVLASLYFGGWGSAPSKSPSAATKGDYGTLVIFVTWDDTRHTPATNVYVEAHGFVRSLRSSQSYALRSTAPGKYEARIPPAVYDVFISDGISKPVCKRFEVTVHGTVSWRVRLVTDLEYTLK